MNIFYLLLSVLGGSAGNVFDKLKFKRNHIDLRHFMFLSFLGMSLCTALFIWLADLPFPELATTSLVLVGLIIGFSFVGNVFDALSLKADDLSLREPLLDFYPILAGIFGYIFFPAERKTIYLWAFVAGIFVVHWGMHRIKLGKIQKKGLGYLVLAITLYAVQPSLEKQALQYLHPAYITLFRVSGIFLLTSIFLPVKNLRGFTSKKIAYSAWSSIACTIGVIAGLYAINAYGVVLTMLFMMLGPGTRYLAGQFILKEKVRKVEVISSLMLTIVVAVAVFAG